MSRVNQHGVSLIEIVIGLAIVAIGIAWAIPNYSVWMQNTQIRNTAESIVAGLQLARSEAISRDRVVEFVLTNSSPISANEDVDIATLGSSTGKNWVARTLLSSVAGAENYTFITGQSGSNGASSTTVQATDAALALNLYAVTFNGLGRTLLINADASAPIAKLCVKSSRLSVANGARILEIDVATAGHVKMCDPTVTDVTDTRRCLSPGLRCS